MRILTRTARSAAALMLAVLIVACSMILPGITLTVHAATELTSIGLAEHGLMAYRDGWQYAYGTYGNKNSNGVRSTDCSGLVYSYLCWDDATGTVKPNWSYPRTVTQQINKSSVSGSIDSIPRTHGLLITVSGATHVGIYVGNGMVVDNSTWGVNMRYDSVNKHGWTRWYKLDCITYPTTGWYEFDGNYFYYENGEYVVDTTRTIDGVTYTFGSDGIPDIAPGTASNDGYNTSTSNMNAKVTAGVRLRQGPGTDYGTVTVLADGTRINVISTKHDGWYAVETGSGQKGYVSAQYVKITGTVTESDDLPSFEEPSASTEAASSESAKVTTAVHLRSEKSTGANSLGVISAGTSVIVTDESDSSWYKVSVGGKTGYMFREYVTLDSKSAESTSQSTGSTGTTFSAKTTVGVHLRSGKGTNYDSVALLDKDTAVTVTDASDSEWYGVTVNGKSGYIYSQYVKTASESMTTSAYLNLRTIADISGDVLLVIPENTSVPVVEKTNSEWYKVSYNNKTGYVSTQYLK